MQAKTKTHKQNLKKRKKEKKYTIHHRHSGDHFPSFFFIFIYSLCVHDGGIGTHMPWHIYRAVRDNFLESGLSTMCFRRQFPLFLFGLTSIHFSCGAYSILIVTPPQILYFKISENHERPSLGTVSDFSKDRPRPSGKFIILLNEHSSKVSPSKINLKITLKK